VFVTDGKKLRLIVAKSYVVAIATVAHGNSVQDPLASDPATRVTSGVFTVAVALP